MYPADYDEEMGPRFQSAGQTVGTRAASRKYVWVSRRYTKGKEWLMRANQAGRYEIYKFHQRKVKILISLETAM